MKCILSRKGFDSSWGGHASPILARSRLLSLPIPVDPAGPYAGADDVGYADLQVPGVGLSYDALMRTHGIVSLRTGRRRHATADVRCHLDPDIIPDVVQRSPGGRRHSDSAEQRKATCGGKPSGPATSFCSLAPSVTATVGSS